MFEYGMENYVFYVIKSGITFAIFKSDGKTSLSKEVLQISVKGYDNSL